MNKLNTVTLLVLVTSSMAILDSCTKKEAKKPIVVPAACDTVSFSKHIKPLFEANCAISGCHTGATPAGNASFTTYESIKAKAADGKIEARAIDGKPTFMPPTGPLPQAQRDLIKCWLDKGSPNN
jgi:hypothetical protein